MCALEEPEIRAKMDDGRCECVGCTAGRHTAAGHCIANSVTDTVPPYFEVCEIFELGGSRVPTTWLWLCGPCVEESRAKKHH